MSTFIQNGKWVLLIGILVLVLLIPSCSDSDSDSDNPPPPPPPPKREREKTQVNPTFVSVCEASVSGCIFSDFQG